MNRKIILTAIAAVVVAGGIWSQVSGQKHDSELAPSVAAPTEQAPPSVPPLDEQVLASLPELTITTGADGIAVVTNASSTLVLANKNRNLPADYEPDDLVVPNVAFSFSGDDPKKQLRREAATALESLFAAAKQDGIDIMAVSGYRSYKKQRSLYNYYVSQHGEEEAARFSARAGQSEHQTGLAMDVSSASVGYGLEESYGETTEGKWLVAHAAEHGFILRYLNGKENITGYQYEPWHIRYVGTDVAKQIMDQGITLEEFFDSAAVQAVQAGQLESASKN